MQQHSSVSKVFVLFILLCADLGMNCSFDFDDYNLEGRDLIAVPLAIQLVIEISVFLILFLSMADTYLFRVGLLGILLKKFRFVLLLHPLYMALTLFTGAYRVQKLGSDYDIVGLWRDDGFVALSVIHKLVSVFYYVINLRATIQLGSNIYFDRTVWVNLVKQHKVEV
mmetsp:Transcript_20603/g.29567  ORF Transcript_20603/g.29567 Transcript_20603/m.29567 type:complete len:168 (-) Transcript_20603:120-623(-)